MHNNYTTIILAAGLGTRMNSDKAKVLHEISGKPMIRYVVETALQITDNIVCVIGYQAEAVKSAVNDNTGISFALQEEQLGTGHAVLCAVPNIPDSSEQVLILYGDVPLLTKETLDLVIKDHVLKKQDLTVLAVEVPDPTGYGRIVLKDNELKKIVEQADASEEEKKITLINTGIYLTEKNFLIDSLKKIKSDNAQKELYLTDIIEIGCNENQKIGVFIGEDYKECTGINSLEELINVREMSRKTQ